MLPQDYERVLQAVKRAEERGLAGEEAIQAATLNGAYAMGLETTHGSICPGKQANLIVTKNVSSYSFLPYAFGTNWIEATYINGERHYHDLD